MGQASKETTESSIISVLIYTLILQSYNYTKIWAYSVGDWKLTQLIFLNAEYFSSTDSGISSFI